MRSSVFISHSCNQDPADLSAGDPRRVRLERARAVRSAVTEKLGSGFELWLDKDRLKRRRPVAAGDLPRFVQVLAAVILLDDDAFASPWVRQEATIFNFRRRLSPSFVLIPVLLDEGSSSRFDEGDWKPLALRDWMALEESPDQVADEVASRLSDLAEVGSDPDLDYWVSTLAGLLRPIAAHYPSLLDAACAELDITPEDWTADNASAIRPFTQALLSAPPKAVATAANLRLKPAIPDRESRQAMRRLLIPIWVNLAAAGSMAAVLRTSPTGRRALLNTGDENVAAEYVDRAVNCAEGVIQVRSHGVVGEDPEDFFMQLEQLIIDACPPLENDPSSDNFVAWLNDYPYRRPVVFIRPAFAAQQLADLLDRLADRFPGISLFVLDSNIERMPDDLAVLRAPVIEPPPDAAAEKSANLYRSELKLFAGE